jgi:hypothetical protein
MHPGYLLRSRLRLARLPTLAGGIEPDELLEAMKSLGLKSSYADAKAIIAEIDKNKDGKIDFHGTQRGVILPVTHPMPLIIIFFRGGSSTCRRR